MTNYEPFEHNHRYDPAVAEVVAESGSVIVRELTGPETGVEFALWKGDDDRAAAMAAKLTEALAFLAGQGVPGLTGTAIQNLGEVYL